jgi:hypothetical protein
MINLFPKMEEERPLFTAENIFRITVKLYYEMDEIRERILKIVMTTRDSIAWL